MRYPMEAPGRGCGRDVDPIGQHRTSGGRLAQRESASFTPRRSLVRSQYRPPGQRLCRSSSKITMGAIPVARAGTLPAMAGRRGWGEDSIYFDHSGECRDLRPTGIVRAAGDANRVQPLAVDEDIGAFGAQYLAV